MNTNKLSKSTRIFIRREKVRIRRNVSDLKEQEKLISGLYSICIQTYLTTPKPVDGEIE